MSGSVRGFVASFATTMAVVIVPIDARNVPD
jgi:hypothetical protein